MTKANFKKFLTSAKYGRCLNDQEVFGFNLFGDGSMSVSGLAEKRPENHSFQNYWKELTRSDKRAIYRAFIQCVNQGYNLKK